MLKLVKGAELSRADPAYARASLNTSPAETVARARCASACATPIEMEREREFAMSLNSCGFNDLSVKVRRGILFLQISQ